MSESKIYIGKSGKIYIAQDPPLGQGGEGAVFKIQEDQAKVMKVFWEEIRTLEREKKLISMTDMHLSDNLTAQNTWPIDLVYENDKFAGFVMKAVTDSIPVNRLYMEEYKRTCTYEKRYS